MEAGRIVEEGTHNSLLAAGKIYAMLVQRQSGHSMDTARPRDDDEPSPALKVGLFLCFCCCAVVCCNCA